MLGQKTGGRQKGTQNRPKVAVQPPEVGIIAEPKFPKYRLMAVADLAGYENNPRVHSAAQIAKLVASLKEFGFTNPVLTDGKRGIIAGHGRVIAAKKLGLEKVPVIELSHLTRAQRQAYVVADNKLSDLSGWDEELLALEMGELKELGFDLALTGFDEGELGMLFDVPEPEPERQTKKTVTCPKCKHSFAP